MKIIFKKDVSHMHCTVTVVVFLFFHAPLVFKCLQNIVSNIRPLTMLFCNALLFTHKDLADWRIHIRHITSGDLLPLVRVFPFQS